MIRQQHVLVSRGGVLADTAAAHFHDLVRSREGRWKLRSALAAPGSDVLSDLIQLFYLLNSSAAVFCTISSLL